MQDRDSMFTELFHAYYNSLINFCISKGKGSDVAEDIVSETFARALAKADQLLMLAPKQQRSWLYSTAVNIIKETHAHTPPVVFSEIEDIENFIVATDTLEQFQSEEDYQQYVQQTYNELATDKERELFELIFDQKIDYTTLSQKLDVSPGTIRVMVCRLRKKLRIIVNKILIN